MSTTLSLIVPCYNESKTLKEIVEKILAIQNAELCVEIVIVDDCSSDNSLEIANELAAQYPEVKVFRHEINLGKGAALRTGFCKASGDYVGVQDADMEYDPNDYCILLEPLVQNKADVVFGSRYLKAETRRVLYFWHSYMNHFLTWFSNLFTDFSLTDMETCYKLFRREIIQDIAKDLKENRFGFEPEVTARVAALKCRVYECAIHYTPRSYGEGKKIGWKDGVRALYCAVRYGISHMPIPTQLLFSSIFAMLAVIANILVFYFGYRFSLALIPDVAIAYVVGASVNAMPSMLGILWRDKPCGHMLQIILLCACVVILAGVVDYGLFFLGGRFGLYFWSKIISASLVFVVSNHIYRRLVFR